MRERAGVPSMRRRVGVLLGAVSAAATLLGAAVEPSVAVQPGRPGLVAVTDYASPEGCGRDTPADGRCPFSQVTLIDPRTGISRTLPCEPRPVIACGDHTPTWTPAGESLFTRDNDLWTAPAAPAPPRLFLSSPRRVAVGASFAPDAKRFVFAVLSDNPLRDAVFVARRDGSGVRRLTPEAGQEPAWSSRNLIAFEGTWRGLPAVFTVRPDGHLLRPVARRAGQPDWSPSGKLLAVSSFSKDGRRRRIVVVRLGGRARVVTRGRDDQSPAWSPDGRWLAFRRGADVYVLRMRRRRVAPVKHTLKRLCRVCASPSWQSL